jgi:hypothetical protein
LAIYPNEWLRDYEPRVQPHPISTKLQKLDYDQSHFDELDKVFIFATEWFHDATVPSPIRPSYEKAQVGNGWRVEAWPFGHDLVREAPERVTELLLHEALE